VIEETEATPAFDTAILPPSIGRSEDAENPEPAPRRPRRRSTAQAAE
jgi:hypothetical protein